MSQSDSTYVKLMSELPLIGKVLKELPESVQQAAYTSLVSALLGIKVSRSIVDGATKSEELPVPCANNDVFEKYDTAAELHAALHPSTEPEKALVIGAFLQKKQGLEKLTGQQINGVLKDLGHGIGNITGAIQSNIDQRPSLMIQLKKRGSSRQARKEYKVTEEGIFSIIKMIANIDTAEQ